MRYSALKPFFNNKKVVILGFGREGKSWLEILRQLNCCKEIAIADSNSIESIAGCTMITGGDYLKKCSGYDLILQSPGVIIKDFLSPEDKSEILTQTELLLKTKPCKIIGVTGTKGKSTVSSLIYHFLKSCGFNSMLIGNIGVPPLARFEEMEPDMTAVCEMSCHQLEFAKHSPEIALLLNIFPEHLDHYLGFDAYKAAKENIYLHQKKGDTAIINSSITPLPSESDIITASMNFPADIYVSETGINVLGNFFSNEDIKTDLLGIHNRYNIAVALAAAIKAGADPNICLESLPEFSPLEHRLERVRIFNGVEYINDSISTIPEAAIAAVTAEGGADCLILGGMDRGISYKKLTDFLNKGSVKNVILMPDSGLRIAKELDKDKVNILFADNMPEAVKTAASIAEKRVILSPASASYGFYKNFEERGKHFKQLVNDL